MKKSLMATAAAILFLSLSQTAHAQSGNMWSDFYAGGYGGYGWANADMSGGPTFDVNGLDYGLLIGYELGGLTSKPFGLNGALEFHYGWSNADETRTVGLGTVKVSKDHEWGLSFRPGLAFISEHSPMGLKPYGILGYRRTEFDTTGVGNDQFNGFELGIGTELMASSNFGTRLDYTHVFYASKSGIDPDDNDLRLGVVFHF